MTDRVISIGALRRGEGGGVLGTCISREVDCWIFSLASTWSAQEKTGKERRRSMSMPASLVAL